MMHSLRGCIVNGEPDATWQYVFGELAQGRKEKIKSELQKLVCRRYWWLTGELFLLYGELGWGPGHREWEGTFLPDPVEDALDRLRNFVRDLTSLPESSRVQAVLDDYMGEARSKTAQILNLVLAGTDAGLLKPFILLYEKVMQRCTIYEIGAARMYCDQYIEGEHDTAFSGFALLLTAGLNRLKVRHRSVKLRRKRQQQMCLPVAYLGASACTQQMIEVMA